MTGVPYLTSPRVKAAAMVDRWIYTRTLDVRDLSDGEMFELALHLQQAKDYLSYRRFLSPDMRFLSSPFPKTKAAARKRFLGLS